MCGICGEYRLDQNLPDLQRLQNMLSALERRGPDRVGSFSEGKLAFGHRRLSIIDLSEKAHQPMVDPDQSLALVFNGTIYNHPELRYELSQRGHRFFSTGDSEVILKAYAEWGEACVEHFFGMFAFAIWDMRQQTLFLARDRLGIKPLYFSKTAKSFRFASNTQALLRGGEINTQLDSVALHHQFSLHAVIPAPRTLLQGVRKLPPGHTLTIDANGDYQQKCYWDLVAKRPEIPRSEDEWTEIIHHALHTAVERRNNIADVPVGVLLSGGLDSSLLVGLLRELGYDDVRTFTIGFEDHSEEKGSEYEYSDAVVKMHQTQHHKFHIPNNEVLKRLPEAVDNMAEPMFGQDAVAFYLLAEQVSKHVKVVQSGQGADEVFAGYFWYPLMNQAKGDYLQRFRHYYFDRDHDEMAKMLMPRWISRDYSAETLTELLESPQAETFIDAVLRADVTTLITDDPVKRVDNMTMAWGLEARVPFLDHQLVELAAQMPPELKLRDHGKYMLKKIARGLIPDSVIDRPKGYFPVPALKFVRGEFLDFMRDIVNSAACQQRGLYQHSYIDRLLSAPEQHLTRIQGSKLWHIALLEFWLQRNVDNSV